MNPRLLASGVVLCLALTGCVHRFNGEPVEYGRKLGRGNYSFAEHPGKGLAVLSTRMKVNPECRAETVAGSLDFRNSDKPVYVSEGSFQLLNTLFFGLNAGRFKMKALASSAAEPEKKAAPERARTTVFAVQEVPAGRYVLGGIRVFVPESLSKFGTMAIPVLAFSIKPGEVVYLGELEIDIHGEGCRFTGFVVRIRDEWEEDLGRFADQVLNIRPEDVQLRLLRDESFPDRMDGSRGL
ncbi:hypothetical protein ACLESD_21470 [Pyxidicoccus sp. 3LFB2]